ncbi:GCN5-related N-acetyltransferase [Halovivax asiaticus JCM 14624]|uniref:GCN5-related N-acetyltransferase n=1 Tax=Halovivax asiaticus JCM 14624 TaxID=1227490 RepID=M0BX28_9EURY|nr:GNAT family N-acetyltransferase [Halovivax asiaticus]ELZ14229.1 GCN5-related N-acetyltransferase [Halovivax asiaticus JCM 14624]
MPQNPEPVVECASGGDVDEVLQCWLRLADEQREHGSAVRVDENRGPMRQILSAQQVANGLLVARLAGEIVGFVTFTVETETIAVDPTRGLLTNIWIDPAHRNEGIGTALLDAAETELAERGADVCRLEVLEDNEAARRFYRDHDYESSRRIMERPLPAREKNDTHSKGDG